MKDQKDLVALVSDQKMRHVLKELLQRHKALRIRAIVADVYSHPRHDPGVLGAAGEFLSIYTEKYLYALALFDREGCGQEDKTADELEREVQQQLDASGWKNRSAVVVLDPELEIWVWSNSPHVPEVLGLPQNELAQLIAQWTAPGSPKPERPKELMETVVRRANRGGMSSALYKELAKKVSTERCTDRAFQRLRETLQGWFPK